MLGDFRGIYFRRHKVGTWVKEYEGIDVPRDKNYSLMAYHKYSY